MTTLTMPARQPANDAARLGETPAPRPATPTNTTVGLAQLKTLEARELDALLHAHGLSRKAAGWITGLVMRDRERPPSRAGTTCATATLGDAAVQIVVGRCSACPNARG